MTFGVYAPAPLAYPLYLWGPVTIGTGPGRNRARVGS